MCRAIDFPNVGYGGEDDISYRFKPKQTGEAEGVIEKQAEVFGSLLPYLLKKFDAGNDPDPENPVATS